MNTFENSRGGQAECVWEGRAHLGESPCWDPRGDALFWLDIADRRLHSLQPAEGLGRSWELETRVCSLDVPGAEWERPPDLAGQAFLACGDDGFCWLGVGEDTVQVVPISHPEADLPSNRFNDGKVGPDGRYWAGTMDEREAEASGSLYAFEADGSFRALDSGYVVSNGPAFAPDGATIYHTDSARRTIFAFDLELGAGLSNKREFVVFSGADGHPDGMTTDRAGNLWVAMWDGGRVEKVSPEGERLASVSIPTPRPTSCTFVDSECTDMFVTSASDGVGEKGLAGALFRVRVA